MRAGCLASVFRAECQGPAVCLFFINHLSVFFFINHLSISVQFTHFISPDLRDPLSRLRNGYEPEKSPLVVFGLWRICFPPVLVRTVAFTGGKPEFAVSFLKRNGPAVPLTCPSHAPHLLRGGPWRRRRCAPLIAADRARQHVLLPAAGAKDPNRAPCAPASRGCAL